ncbi:MAG: cation transporter [Gammaproteobacteria bacterium]|nr:cation transporter [Gammaproteobacteria bacterium]
MEIDHRHRVTKKVTLTGALVNALLALAQILSGLIGQSQALLADGIHTLSDLSSDFIVLYATRQSSRAADDEHPYGHGRIETLASLLLGVILISVGISLGIRGGLSIFSTGRPDPELITLFFAGLAIISKESLYRYTIKAARSIHSTLLESNALHHRSDALSSIVVVIGIAAQLAGIPHMDAAASAVVALMIMSMGYRLGRKSLNELIDSSLDESLVGEIRSLICKDKSIKAIHSLRTRSMGGLGYVDAELRVNPRLSVSEAHHIAFLLEQGIKQEFPSIIDVSIHIDPFNESDHEHVSELPNREELLAELQDHWKSISSHSQISQINLHYLNHTIDIDIVFPLALCKNGHDEQTTQLINKTSEIDCIGQVSIFYGS